MLALDLDPEERGSFRFAEGCTQTRLPQARLILLIEASRVLNPRFSSLPAARDNELRGDDENGMLD